MNQKNGLHYFALGWSLIQRPEIRRFVILPMLANIVVMSALFYWLFSSFSDVLDSGLDYMPSWLQWLGYIASTIGIIFMAIFFCYFFSTITNIIAAPFNGLLAEKVEAHLTGLPVPDSSIFMLVKDVPRIMLRELKKLIYYLVWAICILLTTFIPFFGISITPIIWFIFTAWMINIQYADYAFDNHKVSFAQMRQLLRQNKLDNIAFGMLVSFCTMIPILNLVIMPVAVCGSTAMWVDRYRNQIYFPDGNLNVFRK